MGLAARWERAGQRFGPHGRSERGAVPIATGLARCERSAAAASTMLAEDTARAMDGEDLCGASWRRVGGERPNRFARSLAAVRLGLPRPNDRPASVTREMRRRPASQGRGDGVQIEGRWCRVDALSWAKTVAAWRAFGLRSRRQGGAAVARVPGVSEAGGPSSSSAAKTAARAKGWRTNG